MLFDSQQADGFRVLLPLTLAEFMILSNAPTHFDLFGASASLIFLTGKTGRYSSRVENQSSRLLAQEQAKP
jgi:hypothetical protein